MTTPLSINGTFYFNRDITRVDLCTTLVLGYDDVTVSSGGTAYRMEEDDFDAEIGYQVALAKALHNLANKIDRRAAGMMKHAEDLKHRIEVVDGEVADPVLYDQDSVDLPEVDSPMAVPEVRKTIAHKLFGSK